MTIDHLGEASTDGFYTATAADPGSWAQLGDDAAKLRCPAGATYALRAVRLHPEAESATLFGAWSWRLDATLRDGNPWFSMDNVLEKLPDRDQAARTRPYPDEPISKGSDWRAAELSLWFRPTDWLTAHLPARLRVAFEVVARCAT